MPLTRAYIRGCHGQRIRHDAFLFPVPKPLQQAADDYAWNRHNPFIRGAIIQFERQNGLLGPQGISEGNLHPSIIRKLFSRCAKKNAWSWEWVYVTKASGTRQPEQMHIWERGMHFVPHSFGDESQGFVVLNGWIWGTVVNTGVLGSTPEGTWPVYQRLPSTTMRGVFPVPISRAVWKSLAGKQVPQWAGSRLMMPARGTVDGHYVTWQPYNDPDILWVNYFDDGRGIHYYPRARYGFPQSAGCVEQPYDSAPVTYRLLHYGVPVTISSARFRDAYAEIRHG
ncbi:L,D-transpeptidase family protein [Acidithiobacillus sp. M4-SHS-6]|uniref:L,D-transpeptidase family protein n=1 Tax=Acidithiobacillus sp. M4-SHS-6 TaxID=3383024 RepID=UPI0039BE1E80